MAHYLKSARGEDEKHREEQKLTLLLRRASAAAAFCASLAEATAIAMAKKEGGVLKEKKQGVDERIIKATLTEL